MVELDLATGQTSETLIENTGRLDVFLPDQNVAINGQRGKPEFWSFETGETIKKTKLPKGYHDMESVFISKDPNVFVTTYSNGGMCLWNANGYIPSKFIDPGTQRLFSMDLHPAKPTIVLSGPGEAPFVRVDLDRGTNFTSPESKMVGHLNIHPEGEKLLLQSGRTLQQYDLWSGEKISRFSLNSMWNSAYTPSGDRILTADRDGLIQLWEAESAKEIYDVRNSEKELPGSLCFPGTEGKFISNNFNGAVLREIGTGKEITRADGARYRGIMAVCPSKNWVGNALANTCTSMMQQA